MLKKGIVILLILSMLAALLSACGSTSDPGTQADTETKSGEPGSKETDAMETDGFERSTYWLGLHEKSSLPSTATNRK